MSASDPLAYIDASGLVKFVVTEPETEAMSHFLAGYRLASSAIAITEVMRAVARLDESLVAGALERLQPLFLVPPIADLLRSAGRLRPPGLRTLDAIHVASALSLGSGLDLLVTYDARMRAAAEQAGLRVEAPGLP
ncbi:MAG: type II toxin-antitoxin system VapC family toxin [Dehalococcoidia bacterium]